MVEAPESNLQDAGEFGACAVCNHKYRKGWSFAFRRPLPERAADDGVIIKCLWCAIRHLPTLRRSSIVAVVVGTVLTLLNQGDILFTGSWNSALYWKVPLTYCVPFCVATYGALSNSRR